MEAIIYAVYAVGMAMYAGLYTIGCMGEVMAIKLWGVSQRIAIWTVAAVKIAYYTVRRIVMTGYYGWLRRWWRFTEFVTTYRILLKIRVCMRIKMIRDHFAH